MGTFEDVNRFLEDRLDEFLKNNPHLEIKVLQDQLQQQEKDTANLIKELDNQEKNLQKQIISIAQDIQKWHARVEKAQSVGEKELAQKATEREASLLHQGHSTWGQMEGVKKQLVKAKELLEQIKKQKQELKLKAKNLKPPQKTSSSASNSATTGWNQGNIYNGYSKINDPLEQTFQQWEIQAELEDMKRNLKP